MRTRPRPLCLMNATVRPDRSGNVTAQHGILSTFKITNWSSGDSPYMTPRLGTAKKAQLTRNEIDRDAQHDPVSTQVPLQY